MLKIISQMDPAKVWGKIEEISRKAGRSVPTTLADVIWCAFRYGAGPYDYELFELYTKSAAQRKTFVTRGQNNSFVKKYNHPDYYDYFDNKAKLNEAFSDYLGRKWCSTAALTAEKLAQMQSHSPRLVYKPLYGSCGRNVEIIDASNQSTDALLTRLRQTEPGVLEEYVVQAPEMNALFSNSVNTVRLITFLQGDVVHPIAAFLRIGTGTNRVDNLNHGGISAKITLQTGRIDLPGADKNGKTFFAHPDTGTPIVGFQIPRWNEVIALCAAAAKKMPQIRYVGWDIAVCDDGVKMIEANRYPGHDILQLPVYTPDGIGMKKDFQALYGHKSV